MRECMCGCQSFKDYMNQYLPVVVSEQCFTTCEWNLIHTHTRCHVVLCSRYHLWFYLPCMGLQSKGDLCSAQESNKFNYFTTKVWYGNNLMIPVNYKYAPGTFNHCFKTLVIFFEFVSTNAPSLCRHFCRA